jgi:RND family efflux transporter MFP subunit
MSALSALRKDPPREDPPVPVLQAQGLVAQSGTHRTTLRGFGSARSRQTVEIAPQVTGRVVAIHPRLEVGEVIGKGEVLLEIDRTDFEIRRETALAELARVQADRERIDREERNDTRRLDVAAESLELARRDEARVQSLVSEGGAASEAALDIARLAVKARESEVIALESALALYPSRRLALEAQERAAQASLRSAEVDIERCTITAPFDARIEMKAVEAGQMVSSMAMALRLADDSKLEIPVSLDSREVSRWLDFEPSPDDKHWFGKPNPARPVSIRWTERPVDVAFEGFVSRVESYDSATRTFTLIVELVEEAGGMAPEFPLADGMFCELAIEGREARDVFAIPREAIDSQGNVLLGNEGRILATAVTVIHAQGDTAFVSDGLKPGDIVLTSRPPRVLDGSAVEVKLLPAESLPVEGAASSLPVAAK